MTSITYKGVPLSMHYRV